MFKNSPKHQTHSSAAEAPEGSSELMQVCLTALTQLGRCQLLPLPSQLSSPGPQNYTISSHQILEQDTTLIRARPQGAPACKLSG